MLIYKIFRQSEWAAIQSEGETLGAPIDLQDGYIHFSTAKTVEETASKHFAGESDLVLAVVDTENLGDALKWEVSRGGLEFPHLYAKLSLSQVERFDPIPADENGFNFEGLL